MEDRMPTKKKNKKPEDADSEDELEQEILGEDEKEEVGEGVETPTPIKTELTELPGIGPKTEAKLREAGYPTVVSIAVATPSELNAVADLGLATAQKLIIAARQKAEFTFKPANLIYKQRQHIGKITTCSQNLDNLLGGGVEAQAITEVYGEFRTGKTQIAHQLAVCVQQPLEKGGLNGSAIYIDSEGTFRPERIVQMSTALGLDPDKILENIQVARVYNSDHQMFITDKAQEMVVEKNVKLIVVDSVTSHFRAEYMGRENLPVRQGKLNRHLKTLQRIADIYSCVVFLTNQAMADPSAIFGDPTRSVGGHVLAHTPQTRIYLKKSKDTRRVAKLIDSPSLPESECIFTISEVGIRDP